MHTHLRIDLSDHRSTSTVTDTEHFDFTFAFLTPFLTSFLPFILFYHNEIRFAWAHFTLDCFTHSYVHSHICSVRPLRVSRSVLQIRTRRNAHIETGSVG